MSCSCHINAPCAYCEKSQECSGCGDIKNEDHLFLKDKENWYCDNNKCEFINKKVEEIKMKPFDLEKMLSGDPVITRNGKKIIEFAIFKNTNRFPVQGLIEGDSENAHAWTKTGRYIINHEHDLDLFMAPKIKNYWMNLYRVHGDENEPCLQGRTFETEKIAIDSIENDGSFLKTIKFEIEE